MKIKKTIAFLIILVFLISGCNFSEIKGTLPGMKTTVSGKEDFIGGTKGVEVDILRPAEDGKIYSNQPFNVVIRVSNDGESKAVGETCTFSSFSECVCQEFRLEGKRRLEGEKLEGEQETLTFEGGTITKEEVDGQSYFITARTKYNYKTYGIIKTCVKEDPYSEEGCQILGNMLRSASSAPLGISKVTEEIIPETDGIATLVFDIELKKTGEGDLYSLDENFGCETPNDIKKKINLQLLNAPGDASCDSTELRNDEATAQCRITNVQVSGESYETDVTLEVEYAYETVDSNKFEVV